MTSQDPPVFIVDDDPSVRTALVRLLTSVGIACRAFGDNRSCLEALAIETPGCFILDVRMPGHSGLDLQRELHERGYAIPVMFVTAHADVALAVRAMKAGAIEVFTKPFDDQALLDAVQAALEQERPRRERLKELQQLHARFEALTTREREVMALVVQGLLNKQVAATLGTTEKTVKAHRSQVMRKMEAHSLVDLVRMSDRLRTTLPPQPASDKQGPKANSSEA